MKITFNGKEKEWNRQLEKLRVDFSEECDNSNTMKKMMDKLKLDLNEKDKKIDLVSAELNDRTNAVHWLTIKIEERERELQKAQDSISNLQGSHQSFSQEAETKISELESTISTMEVEYSTMNSKLDDAISSSQDLKQNVDQLLSDLHLANDEKEKLKGQLSDSKKILESTTEELYRRLSDANHEIDDRKEVEATLKGRELEQNEELNRLTQYIEQSEARWKGRELEQSEEINRLNKRLEESEAKAVTIESNFNKLQSCLFDSSQKSKIVQSELQLSKQRQHDVETESTVIQSRLKDTTNDLLSAQNQIKSLEDQMKNLESTNKKMQAEKDLQMKCSQQLRLQLNEMQRNIETKESYYNNLVSEKSHEAAITLQQYEEKQSNLFIEINTIKDQATKERDEYQNIIQQLRTELDEKIVELNNIDNEKVAAIDALEQMKQKNAVVNNLHKEEINTIIDQHNQHRENSRKEMDDLRNEISVMEGKLLAQESSSKDYAEQELNRMRSDLERVTEEKEMLCSELNQQILHKEDNLSKMIAQHGDLQNEYSASISLIEALKEELRSMRDVSAIKSKENDYKLTSMQEMFATSVKEKEDFIEKLQTEIEQKQDTIDALRTAADEKGLMVEQLAEINSSYKAREAELEQSLLATTKKLETSEDQLNEEKAKIEAAIAAAQRKVVENDGKLTSMQEMFATSVKEKEDFIEKLQTEIEQKQDAIDALAVELNEARIENERVVVDVIELESRCDSLSKSLENEKMQIKSKTESIRDMFAASIKEKQDFITELQADIKQKQDSIYALNIKLNEAENEKERVDVERIQFKSRCDSLSKSLEAEKLSVNRKVESMRYMFDASVKEKENFIDKLQTEIEKKQDTIDALAVDLSQAEIEKERLIVNVIELESRCDSLSKSLEEEKVCSRSSSMQLTALQKQWQETKIELCNTLNEKTMIENELTEQMNWFMTQLEDEELSYKEKISKLTTKSEERYTLISKQLDDCLIDKTNLAGEIIKLQASLEEKSLTLNESQAISTKKELYWNSVLDHLESLIDSMKKDKSETDSAFALLKSKHEETKALVALLNDQITNAQKLIDIANDRVQSLEDGAKSSEHFVQSLMEELMKTCDELNIPTFEGEKKGGKSVSDNLVEFIRYLRDNSKDLKSNAIAGFELANSRERAVSRLERTLNSKERDIESLHGQVEKFKTLVNDLKLHQKDLKDRNGDLEKKVDVLEDEMESLELDFCESEDIVAELRHQKVSLEAEVKFCKDELDTVKEKMQSTETEIKECEVKLVLYKDALKKAEERMIVNEEESSEKCNLISRLEGDLEAVSSEVENLVNQNETLEKELHSLLSKLRQSEKKENEATKRIEELETTLKQQTAMFQTYETENKTLFEDNRRLLSELDLTETQLAQLKKEFEQATSYLSSANVDAASHMEKIKVLECALLTAKSEAENNSESSVAEKKKLQNRIAELTDASEQLQARLTGAERLSKIHDKECVRLLNDIESKGEEINKLKSTISELEARKCELESTTEKQIEDIASMKSLLGQNETEIKRAEESFDKATKEKEDLQSKLNALTSNFNEQGDRIKVLENSLNESIQLNSTKEIELQSIKNDMLSCTDLVSQKSDDAEEERRLVKLASPLPLTPELNLSDYLRSPTNLSPTATEIVNKHSELLNDLVKMKSIIRDSITPVKSNNNLNEEDLEMLPQLQKDLDEKNKVLSLMENQVDDLLRDMSLLESALKEKDHAISLVEKQNQDLIIQFNNIQIYLKQLEQSLCTELKRRRKVENELKMVRKENKALALECKSKSAALGQANNALAKKSRDVDEREDTARQLAHQLQSTKHKIIALKAHLKREGLLQETPKVRARSSSSTTF